jgi:hypothetical protein
MRDNPIVVFGTALVLSAIPQLLFNGLIRQDATAAVNAGAVSPIRVFEMAGFGLFVVLVLQSIVSGCITRATVAYNNGQRASLGDCLSVALRRALPVIAVSVLMGLAVMVGLVLLIVPGVMLAVMWAVIVPVVVAEDVGVFGAFGRTAALTKGARWKIFGILLLVILIVIGISLVLGIISGIVLGMSFQNPTIMWQPVAIAFALISGLFTTAVTSCNQTALFVELRNWKDGPEDSKLSDIFA